MAYDAAAHTLFQSAPLTEARGDYLFVVLRIPQLSFNPLPSPKQGETVIAMPKMLMSHSFNPLPSPKQGETSPHTRG